MSQEEHRDSLAGLKARIAELEGRIRQLESARIELLESRERLHFALGSSGSGCLAWTPSDNTLAFDDHLARLLEFGGHRGTTPAAHLNQILHPDDRDGWWELLRSGAQRDSDPSGHPFQIRTEPNTTRHFVAHVRREGTGQALRVMCICREVTEQRRTEQRLIESAERLREAEELAHVGNWWWDTGTGEVQWSDEVYRIFRLDPAAFTPQIDSILALSPWPEENERDQELIRIAIESRERGSYEQRFLRPDGSTGYYHSTFQGIYESDQLVAMRGTVQDITDRKLAELELKRNEENLRVTLNSIGDAVIATDTAGRVTRMNPVAETLTGWPLDDARGRPLTEVFKIINAHTRATVESPVDKVLETNCVVGLANHTVLIHRTGAEYQIADSGAPIRSSAGETVGVVLVFRDVTQEHALEERLRQSEKLQAIGQLAGGVAHDFNNLLVGIIGSTELLQPYLHDDEARELQSVILQSAERASSLTDRLLSFSRHERTRQVHVDVHSVLDDTLVILRHTAGLTVNITTEFHAESHVVEADPALLQSAFLNLGINSVQAMPDGGQITIETHNKTLTEADCERSTFELHPGPHIAVKVRDNGIGIPADQLDRIFEPFFTTKKPGEGTGLGMAAVHGTVRNASGAIAVESQVDFGTEVTIWLPLADGSPEEDLARPEGTPGHGLILVVDDEAIARATAETILRGLGYSVIVADGGKQAVAMFHANRDRLDLVLLDMVMPDMNGRSCLAALRTIDPNVKAILCSGFTDTDIEELRNEGILGIVKKPYRSATLGAAVHQAIHQTRDG